MTSRNLYQASNQWAVRPADERFWTVQEALNATNNFAQQAATKDVRFGDLRVEARDGEVQLLGQRGLPAKLTHYALGQLATRAKVPAGFLRRQPATLAAQNLNWGFKEQRDQEEETSLLFHRNGELMLRAALSPKYERIWDWEVFNRLQNLVDRGWRVPPARPAFGPASKDPRARPATAEDVLEHSRRALSGSWLAINEGDMIAPAGVYASDHDMFCFLVNEDRLIDDGSGKPLARGAFFWNSEVGDKSIGGCTFLYEAVCGNHIVWGAKGVTEFRFRHVGSVGKRFGRLYGELRRLSDSSATEDEQAIKRARTHQIAATKEEVLDVLFGLCKTKRIPLGMKQLTAGYEKAEEQVDRYGSPRTPWGIVNGLTEVSQEVGFADERAKIDQAAGKLLQTTNPPEI